MVQRLRVRGSIALAGALLAGAALAAEQPAAEAAPTVRVTTMVSGLSNPWDLTWVGGLMLYDVRAGQVWSKRGADSPRRVSISGFPSIFAQSEGGLLGMVADPAATTNKRFYTCQSVRDSAGNPLDVRVLRWRLTSDTTAVSDGAPVVTGLPLTSGRHSGCRLRFGGDGRLYVGTGDAAVGTNPQNLGSLGGKVLRVNWDGSIPTDNPFYSRGGNARYVWNYGHRNIQGLSLRPGTTELWSAEHGSDRDDEINLSVRGGNYGWDPVPGYNEATPMTDTTKFPSARRAMWSSGFPTVATSGATFVQGAAWGEWQGALAVGLLKGEGIYLMRFDPSPSPTPVARVIRLPGAQGFGRIRTVQTGPDGALWFTTSNGTNDRIVRVAPTSTPPTVRPGSLVSPSGVAAVRTGTEIWAFVRGAGDVVQYRRSRDDGATWSAWTSAGVTSTDAPSAASASAGRVDLFTRNASRQVVHTWFTGGVRRGSTLLGGGVIAQHGSSVGGGTLDVWGVAPNGTGWRNHHDGTRWSGWRQVGGIFTSGLSASADLTTKVTTVSGRGNGPTTYERTFTASTTGTSGWVARGDGLSAWSSRAMGDTTGGQARIAVATGPDRQAVVQRGALQIGVTTMYTSATDVVSRPNGTFVMFGRGSDGTLCYYDGRPGGYVNRSLGGVVR
ncbi:PQQ-dependent sugar dehydrogenase [Terrabacter terrigena]|uniref:PQQ-dependent sugar dehydrogenase n=1 Tax=Terrabacter terrigena TaxID=574718 RepID=A0ABW3MTH7_9MICO